MDLRPWIAEGVAMVVGQGHSVFAQGGISHMKASSTWDEIRRPSASRRATPCNPCWTTSSSTSLLMAPVAQPQPSL
jgi:hypothetical protein